MPGTRRALHALLALLAAAQHSALLFPTTSARHTPGRLLCMCAGDAGAGAGADAGSGVSAERLAHGVWLLRVDKGRTLVRTAALQHAGVSAELLEELAQLGSLHLRRAGRSRFERLYEGDDTCAVLDQGLAPGDLLRIHTAPARFGAACEGRGIGMQKCRKRSIIGLLYRSHLFYNRSLLTPAMLHSVARPLPLCGRVLRRGRQARGASVLASRRQRGARPASLHAERVRARELTRGLPRR